MLHRARPGVLLYGLHAVRHGPDAPGRHHVPQVLHLGHPQHALLPVENQPVLLQPLQSLLQMLHVLLRRGTGHQHVIQVAEAVVQPL